MGTKSMHSKPLDSRIKVYRKAAKLIKTGWCKDSFARKTKTGKVQYCLMGALGKASGKTFTQLKESGLSSFALGENVCSPIAVAAAEISNTDVSYTALDAWNDRKTTKKSHVLKALKLAEQYVSAENL